jgi:two-component system sensor histidine kinase CiaH
MVKQLQKKFIISAMLAVTILLVVLIGGINVFNYLTTSNDNDRLMEMLCYSFETSTKWSADTTDNTQSPQSINGTQKNTTADISGSQNNPDFPPQDNGTKPPDDKKNNGFGRHDKNAVDSARYAAVAIDKNGKIIRTDVTHISSLTEDEVTAITEALKNTASGTGTYSGFLYRISETKRAEGKVIILLDNGMQISSFFTVLFISVGAGIFGWLLMLLLVILLSKKTIAPVARSIEKQKQFVTNAGHEIKTPLAIILANTDAMELHNGENKWSKNIRAQTLRLSGLMQNLLMLAKMDESSAKLPMCKFDISTAAEDTVNAFIEPAALKGVMIEQDIQKGLQLNGNHDSIVQLITVLLDNAVKYTESGGTISAKLSGNDKNIALSIANTCEPIDHPEKLFDRFYRGDSARTQKNGGYGIGLSVAQAIAELHKGTITAENVSVNTDETDTNYPADADKSTSNMLMFTIKI